MFKSLLIATAMLTLVSCSSKKEQKTEDHSGHTTAKTESTVEKKAGKAQTTCPVMKGNPINKELFVDVEGKRIYICCKGCDATIKKDPKKYIAQLEAEGVVLEDASK